jgi:hypothetical protein
MTEFPTNCPLQDGFTRLDLLAAVKTAPVINAIESNIVKELCGKTHKHTYHKNGKRVYPRRNRKDCIYHILKYDKYGRCDNRNRLKTLCSGVNCGDFKTTT